MAERVKLNAAGMKELLNSSEVSEFLRSRVQPVLATARANAPYETGRYMDSLHIEMVNTDRAVARVVSDVPYALLVEANTGNLARALDQAGGEGGGDAGREMVTYTNKAGKTSRITRKQAENYKRRSKS